MISCMDDPMLAAQSVSADVSEFFRTEVEAFVAWNKATQPASWARVEQLQRVCRSESPTTASGLEGSEQCLKESVSA